MEEIKSNKELAQEAQAAKAAKAFKASARFWQCETNEDGYEFGYLDALQEQEEKLRCLTGYLEMWLRGEHPPPELRGVIEEMNEWLGEVSGKQTEEEKEQELTEVIQSLRDRATTEADPNKRQGLNLIANFLEHPGKS